MKARFAPTSSLSKQLSHALANKEEKSTVLLAALKSKEFPVLQTKARRLFLLLDAESRSQCIDDACIYSVKEDKPEVLCRLLCLLDVKNITESAQAKQKTEINVLENAKTMVRFCSEPSKKRRQKNKVVVLFHAFMESLIEASRYFGPGYSVKGVWAAWTKMQVYIQFPVIVFTAISGIVVGWKRALITSIALIALGVAFLEFYKKCLMPCPRKIANGENLTVAAAEGKLAPIKGRDHEIDQIICELLVSKKGVPSHPLLVGSTGVGKTEVVKGLAQRISEGNVPEELKGKQLYMVNVGNLTTTDTGYESYDKLRKLVKQLAPFKDDVILFLDELHVAVESNKNSHLSDRLKTDILDSFGFPHVIGAMTSKKYDSLVKEDEQFLRRFQKIPIESTDKTQTVAVVKQFVQQNYPGLTVTKEALDLLAKESGQFSQPYLAIKALGQAEIHLRQQRNKELPKQQRKLTACQLLFREKMGEDTLWLDSEEGRAALQKERTLRTKISSLQAQKKQEVFYRKKRECLTEQRAALERRLLSLAHSFAKGDKRSEKELLLLQYYLLPACSQALKDLPQEEYRTIDESVVRPVLDQMKKLGLALEENSCPTRFIDESVVRSVLDQMKKLGLALEKNSCPIRSSKQPRSRRKKKKKTT